MSPIQKILRDPSFWALTLINIGLIYYYEGPIGRYTTIIWVYWCQSVLLGIFNFFDMLTLKNATVGEMIYRDKPVTVSQAQSYLPGFFLFHYGFFHLAYFIFLYAGFGFSGIDTDTLKWAVAAIIVSQLILFIQNRTIYSDIPRNIGSMFGAPYIRIIPMHLAILLPSFIGLEPMLIFIILKSILDVGSHIVTTKHYWTAKPEEEVLTM